MSTPLGEGQPIVGFENQARAIATEMVKIKREKMLKHPYDKFQAFSDKYKISERHMHHEQIILMAFEEGVKVGEAELIRRVEEERQSIKRAFIKEFCNDHGGETRWLRSVALDMPHLLELILEFFDSKEIQAIREEQK